MTQVEQILNYFWSIAPDGATNRQIAEALGIRSQQGVYRTTRDLMYRRRIRGEQVGKTWYFYALDEPDVELASTSPSTIRSRSVGSELTPAEFETMARQVMGRHYGVVLSPGQVGDVPKQFDFVSPDEQVVGDAKYYTLVGGTGLPPAKFSVIAEHVWLLEKIQAREKFLIFGNDRQVPVLWLKRYGSLITAVAFYYLSDAGKLELLKQR
ncbi:MAG: hypothetical protein AB1801_02330 [Chloroflexota bacterium]